MTDIYGAVYDFIEAYATPAMEEAPTTGRIFRSGSNRMALPADNNYATMSIIGQYRQGTNIYTTDSVSELVIVDVQLDFYSDTDSDTDKAMQRAQSIETLARSSVGTTFFANYGIGCQYATDIRNLTFIADSRQYVSRWETTLRLSYVHTIENTFDTFDDIILNIENVDVHHPITE